MGAYLDNTGLGKLLSVIKSWATDAFASKSHTHSGYLTAHQTLKTINGESLVGTGDITISGGSSVGTLLKVAQTSIASRSWATGGSWISDGGAVSPVAPTAIDGYTPIGVVGARAMSSSNLIPSLNINATDKTIRGSVRNMASSATRDGIYVYVLYARNDVI